MKTSGTASFINAILLVLLTSPRPSLQSSNYEPSIFSNWNELRACAQGCMGLADLGFLGCVTNDCYCRADLAPQAVLAVSSCASSACSNTNDVVSATSFYKAYCNSVTNTAVISLITNSPPTAVPGSAVTGTITSTITTTLANGQTTVVGSIVYQYGSGDINGVGNGNVNGNGNSNTNNKSSDAGQVVNSLQLAGDWGWAFFLWVAAIMVAAA